MRKEKDEQICLTQADVAYIGIFFVEGWKVSLCCIGKYVVYPQSVTSRTASPTERLCQSNMSSIPRKEVSQLPALHVL